MSHPFDIVPVTCPLPTVAVGYDEHDRIVRTVQVCGEPLHVERNTWGLLDAEAGDMGGIEDWRVRCERGHVLVVSDHDGEPPELDEDLWAVVRLALTEMGVTNAPSRLDP